MDKTILKKFAIESKVDLTKKIENRINSLYLDEQFDKEQKGDIFTLSNDKHKLNLTKDELDDREKLSKRINEVGKNQVIEEATFTWFNRIIAIRYMEINDFLPLTSDNQSLGFRVLSSKDNTPDPEILKFANLNNNALDLKINKEYYLSLEESKRFNYILLLVCNKLSEVIPQVFDGRTDYIDVLMPDNLLSENGFISKLLRDVPEENFKQVEVIGWLYQYYNDLEKSKAMSKNGKYSKEEIPYVTQLFTPDWIVKYMVENSLGRYYIEHNGISNIVNNWKYFIKDNLNISNEKRSVKNITFIDPCSGSGHILVYAFELLYQMYINEGYSKQDIPELILAKNLYGLDIDDRAGQLSVLSVLLKAREYDKNIYNKEIVRNLNILSIQESNGLSELAEFVDFTEMSKKLYSSLNETFKDAKEIGSLINVEGKDYSSLINEIDNNKTIFKQDLVLKVIPLIKQASILANKYDVYVTNPPYLNADSMDKKLKEYINFNYSNYKQDLYASFMGIDLLKPNGYMGMINQHGWMFLTTFEKTRINFLENYSFVSLIHLGPHTFEEIGGEVVQNSAFVVKKGSESDISPQFYRLVDINSHDLKEKKFLELLKSKKEIYIGNKDFKSIPGSPIAYWISDKIINIFKSSLLLGNLIPVKKGMDTGNNDKYMRFWYEVDYNKTVMFNNNKENKWVCYNKGGKYHRWYGNNYYVINWENDGYELKNSTANIRSEQLYFKPSITWTAMGNCTFRSSYPLSIFDSSGSSMFPENDNYYQILSFCNSKVMNLFLDILNPTLSSGAGTIANLPILYEKMMDNKIIHDISQKNVEIVKEDWDSDEISWDYKKHPLLMPFSKTSTIKESLSNYYSNVVNKKFDELKHNEEELNRIFIDIYGLQDELNFEENDKDVTVRKPDELRDIKSFISYAVGCMFGRYSLDVDGLAYAGGKFDWNLYKTFKPDTDNIIPITDETYFDDDITNRFIKFVEIVFGKETLYENINFIAEKLGKKGTESDEDAIRRYFVNDFYNDHLKVYQKKPIYWLFSSGDKNGFKCLIYLHRYNKELVSKIRVDYLHKTQNTYEKLLSDVEYKLNQDISVQDVKKEQKRKIELTDKINECEVYEEEVADVANRMIDLNLDDGVKVNYNKFTYINPKNGKEESILAKIK